MAHFDRHHHEFQLLDDLQLELLRVEMLATRDERLEQLIRVLVLRAVPTIERVCSRRGRERKLGRVEVSKAIEDASARLLLRLARRDRIPAITAVATELAASCVAAQKQQPPLRLASRRPELRVVQGLGEALKENRLRPNDWKSS